MIIMIIVPKCNKSVQLCVRSLTEGETGFSIMGFGFQALMFGYSELFMLFSSPENIWFA